MDKKPEHQAIDREYEDLDLYTEWVHEAGHDTLIAYLPGFRKEQLRVQVTSTRNLRLIGERQVSGNKWSRFRKEFSVPSNCDLDQVSANFKGGMLYVKLPKLTASAMAPAPTPAVAHPEKPKAPSNDVIPKPQKPTTTDLQTQETKPAVPPKTITDPKQEQPQKPPTNERRRQQNGQENKAVPKEAPPTTTTRKPASAQAIENAQKPPENLPEEEKNARSDEKIINADKDVKKAENAGLVEDQEKAKFATQKKAGQPAETEACPIGGARMGRGILYRIRKDQLRVYKEAVGDFVMELGGPRKLMAVLAVLLLAVVLGLYVKKAMKSSQQDDGLL